MSTEKRDTDIGGLNFRGQPASHLFAGLRFWANYRCGAFLHNFRDARFQERSQQWDNGPTLTPHKGDGKRYIVQSDELITAFLELEAMLL